MPVLSDSRLQKQPLVFQSLAMVSELPAGFDLDRVNDTIRTHGVPLSVYAPGSSPQSQSR